MLNIVKEKIENSKKIQFNIYKVYKDFDLKELLEETKNKINSNCISRKLNKNGFKGFIFEKSLEPTWLDPIYELLDINEENHKFINSYSSYILFKKIGSNIYVVAGGQGYHYIKDYIERDFGLNLIPKLIRKDDSVVNTIKENRLIGNQIYNHRINLVNTSLELESDFANVYTELNIKIGEDIANLIGIKPLDDKDNEIKFRPINVVNKDFICIKKSFSLDELTNVLIKINELYKKPQNFFLNSFIPLTKDKTKVSDLDKELRNLLYANWLNGNGWKNLGLSIVGKNISEYRTEYDEYSFNCEYFKINTQNYIDINDIYLKLNECNFKRRSKYIINNLLNESELTFSNFEKYNISLKNAINGFVEYQEKTYYLINGKWYVLNYDFKDEMTEKFENICDSSSDKFNEIVVKFPCLKEVSEECKINEEFSEDNYNNKFTKRNDILMTHKINKDYIEIADLIFYDETENILYLMCNKTKFSGSSSRDIYNQIEVSSNYIQTYFINKNNNKIKKYYETVADKNKVNNVDFTTFSKWFSSKTKICFIAGYLKNFKVKTMSLNAKFLTYDINKKLNEKGFEFIIANLNFDEE